MKKLFSLTFIILLISSCGHNRMKRPSSRNFELMDVNKDGQVTSVEWANYHNEKFKTSDKNEDGLLTKDEFKKKRMSRRKF